MTVGVDIIEVKRIEKAIKKWGKRFLTRIFLPDEITYCMSMRNPYIYFAARFAAKEAFSKALGTRIKRLSWKDIEVSHKKSGKPYLKITGTSKKLLNGRKYDISISHTDSLAIATVIIESG
ncbi:MAG: holo-[acyl-carrier-protein] synthase [Candidatus Cloacimonas sp. 4484_209]|nr:MAG: holo-[acyl-carrier-protein] synthase [Candidatus Cloacimonas sp. 4484_209]